MRSSVFDLLLGLNQSQIFHKKSLSSTASACPLRRTHKRGGQVHIAVKCDLNGLAGFVMQIIIRRAEVKCGERVKQRYTKQWRWNKNFCPSLLRSMLSVYTRSHLICIGHRDCANPVASLLAMLDSQSGQLLKEFHCLSNTLRIPLNRKHAPPMRHLMSDEELYKS